MSATLTYVYCLVRAARQPSLRRTPAAMPDGEAVRLLEVPALAPGSTTRRAAARHWLAVSTVPARAYGEDALQEGLQQLDWIGPRALAHETVVESFLSSDAVLPMQLFALFTNDDRALEHLAEDRRRILRILSRIERHIEWGVRLTWDAAGRDASTPPKAAKASRRGSRAAPSGAAYLSLKRERRDASLRDLQRARADANRLFRAIAKEAADVHRRGELEQVAPGSRLLLDAAFLVPAARAAAFRAAVRRHSAALKRSQVTVTLTGPWPAYNFI